MVITLENFRKRRQKNLPRQRSLLGVAGILSQLLITTSWSASAASNNETAPSPLKIVWIRDLGRKDAESIKSKGGVKDWAAACTKLAANLMAGKGVWGTGVFTVASCYIQDKGVDKFTAGKDAPNPWVLRFIEGETEATLSLYASENKDADLMASAKFPGSVWAMTFFSDKGFAELVSLRLLNELPMMGFVRKGSLEKSLDLKKSVAFVPPSGKRVYTVPAPPLLLKTFRVSHADGAYLTDLTGNAARSAFVDVKAGSESDEKKVMTNKSAGKYFVTWTFDAATQTASKNQHLAFHDAQGAGKLVPELDDSINEAAKILDEALAAGMFSKLLTGIKANAASGFIGLRYGKQVLAGSALLKKLTFFGLIAEFRGGIVNGLRYYYDKTSQVTDSSNGVPEKLGWSSHTIGKSFGTSLSHVVDRIDFTPKLGIWALDANLVRSVDDQGIASSTGKFYMPRGYSLNLEIGAEWNSSWYKVRPWVSYDYAGAVSAVSKSTITAIKAGLDTFLTIGPSFKLGSTNYKSALLGFVVAEKLSLADKSVKASEDSKIDAFSMTLTFVGAGVAISW